MKYSNRTGRLLGIACALLISAILPGRAQAQINDPIIVTAPALGTTEAISWSFSATVDVDQEARTGSGGGTSGSAEAGDVAIERLTDAKSPVFLNAVLTGIVIPTIEIRRGDFAVILRNSILTEYSVDGVAMVPTRSRYRRSRVPQTEKISINFGGINYRFAEETTDYDVPAHTSP